MEKPMQVHFTFSLSLLSMTGRLVTLGSVLALIATGCLYAQDTYLDRGLIPFNGYMTSDVDHISTADGNLLLDIPLLSYPQRGDKLVVHFSIRSDSKTWQTAPCKPNPCNGRRNIYVYAGTMWGYPVAIGDDQWITATAQKV